jgi:hypothetical protein
MTPAEFQQLLITHAPGVPGITAAARRDDEYPYGLTVTLAGGGHAWWTITGASPVGAAPGSGLPGEDPVPVPDLTGRQVPVAAVEHALIAVAPGRRRGHSHRPLQQPPRPALSPLRRHHRIPRRLEALLVLLRHHPPQRATPLTALPVAARKPGGEWR